MKNKTLVIISAKEVIEARKNFFEIKELKSQLKELENTYKKQEEEIIKKYKEKALIDPQAPTFIVKETERLNIAWKTELEKVIGAIRVAQIMENTEKDKYEHLEFNK